MNKPKDDKKTGDDMEYLMTMVSRGYLVSPTAIMAELFEAERTKRKPAPAPAAKEPKAG